MGDLPGITAAARRPRRAGRRRRVAAPRSTARRRTTRATTSPTTATSTRCSGPSPTPSGCSTSPTRSGCRSSSTSCRTTPPTEHRGSWRRSPRHRVRRARALRVPRGQGRGRRAATQRLGERVRRSGLDPRHRGRRRPGQWFLHLFGPRQPDLNWPNPRCARSSSTSCGSGWTVASTASGWTWRTGSSRPRACPTGRRARPARHDRRPRSRRTRTGTRTASTRSTGLARGPRRLPPATDPRGRGVGRTAERLARYVRDDEMHQAFNFDVPGTGVGRGARCAT